MANYTSRSIRTFIGAKNYKESQAFYKELGYEVTELSHNMSVVNVDDRLAFYLQDYYVKDWVDNSMIFLEVEDVEACLEDVRGRGLVDKYEYVRLTEIKIWDWGREFFMHDPSGVLWHFGQFND